LYARVSNVLFSYNVKARWSRRCIKNADDWVR